MAFKHFEHGIDLPKLTRKTTEEGRRYFTPTGEAYPSVTTVLSILSKAGIIAWRKRVGEDVANRISSQASRRGTAVHKICENHIDNKEDWKDSVPTELIEEFDLDGEYVCYQEWQEENDE